MRLDWFADNRTLEAEVQGSGRNIYSQTVEFNQRRDGSLNIEGFCSCPVGFNCKHVVAALLEQQRRAPPSAPTATPAAPATADQLARWQETLTARQQKARNGCCTC